jgi:hypothetical protein
MELPHDMIHVNAPLEEKEWYVVDLIDPGLLKESIDQL